MVTRQPVFRGGAVGPGGVHSRLRENLEQRHGGRRARGIVFRKLQEPRVTRGVGERPYCHVPFQDVNLLPVRRKSQG